MQGIGRSYGIYYNSYEGLEEAYDVRTSLNTRSYLFAGVVGDVGRVVIITFGGMD